MSATFHGLRLLIVAGCLTLIAWPTNAQTSDGSANQHARSERLGRASIVMRELGPLVEDGSSTAFSINNRGHVVGEATMETGRFVPFLWTPQHGFLRILGDTRGFALDINDRDQVVGMYFLTDDDFERGSGFLWSSTQGFIDLDGFEPQAINNRGQIAGICRDVLQACRWERGLVTRLGVLPGEQFSMAFGINDRGHVVGESFGATQGGRAFVWKPRTGMSALKSTASSVAFGINDRGQMAGTTFPSTGFRAVVWSKEGVPVRLGPLALDTTAGPINERGWVVGHNLFRAFVWFPNGVMSFLANRNTIAIGRAINNRGQVVGYVDGGGRSRPTAVVWTVRASNRPKE